MRGPPGVGKTRLCRELVQRLKRSGYPAVTVVATPNAREIPLGCLAGLAAVETTPDGGLVPAMVASLVARASGPKRLVVHIDDVQYADTATLVVLEQAMLGSNAFLLAALRTGEVDPLGSLWKDGLIDRLDLGPLSDEAITTIIDRAVEGRLDAVSKNWLVRRAAGIPLYLREILDGALASGALAKRSDLWRLDPDLRPTGRLVEIVTERLAALGDDQLVALRAVCMAEPVPLEVLERVVPGGSLESLEQRQMISVERADEGFVVVPGHPVYGEVVRADVPLTVRKRLAAALADSFSTVLVADAYVLQRAFLHVESGTMPPTGLLEAAAVRAHASGDHALARRFGTAALASEPTSRVAIVVAEAAAWLDAPDESGSHYAAAMSLAVDDDERTDVVLSQARARLYSRDGPGALALIRDAGERIESPSARAALTVALAELTGYGGDWPHAVELATSVQGPSTTRVQLASICLIALGSALVGPHTQASAAASDARALLPDVESPGTVHVQWPAIAEACVAAFDGRLDAAVAACVQRASDASTGRDDPDYAGAWWFYAASVSVLAGSITTQTRKHAEQALILLRRRDPSDMYSFAVSTAALISSLCGDHRHAAELIDHYDRDLRASEQKTTALAERAKAWEAMHDVSTAKAVAIALKAADSATGIVALFAAPILHDIVRFGRADLVVDRLAGVARRLDAPLSTTMAAHAEAAADRDPRRLEAVADEFASHGYNQLAAVAYLDADAVTGVPRHRAQVARLTTEELVHTTMPGADDDHRPMGRLTPRQREVALLAARGLTTPEIADALTISRRTVSNHLAAVYSQLGIAGRKDLAEIFDAG